MRSFFHLALIVIPLCAQAQTSSQITKLHEQKGFCSALKAQQEKVKCLEKLSSEALEVLAAISAELAARQPAVEALKAKAEAAAAAAARDADRHRTEPVFRAFTALKAGVETGISYQQYSQLIVAAATEIAHLRSSDPTKKDLIVADHLDRAIAAHNDARTWWDADIKFYSRRDNSMSYGGGLPYSMLGLDGLVGRYSMRTGKADLLGFHSGVSRSAALGAIWQVADAAFEDARKVASQNQ